MEDLDFVLQNIAGKKNHKICKRLQGNLDCVMIESAYKANYIGGTDLAK